MEEQKYEAGRVEISSTEYRDLVTEAVTARQEASEQRGERWRIERERDNLKEELALTRKRLEELEFILNNLRSPIDDCRSTPRREEDN